MSPRKPIFSLSYLSLKALKNILIHTLSDESCENFECVCNYMASATYDTLQELLREILSNISLDANTRVNCLSILLREDVKRLDIGIFPRFYYEQILEIIADRGKRLQHLNLKGVWVKEYPHLLSSLIKKSTNLLTLVIPHMADDTVIEAIVTNLKRLMHLDISGEACYSSEGILRLRSDSLKVLDIGNFGKEHLVQDDQNGIETIAKLILNLPNLTSLKTYSFTGHSLLLLYQKDIHFLTKLSYFHDTNTTVESMDAIIKLCPCLESVHFNGLDKGVVLMLTHFRKLNMLKLSKGDIDEIFTFLRISGDQLQVLRLNHSKNKFIDLSEICVTAPNLLTLELFQMKLIFTNLETYFMNLQNIEILYCEVAGSTLKYLMTHAPFLRRIVIGCEINMTDGDVFRICAESPFTNLEELWLSYARCLTITSVELLMGHCPNLKVLGQLSGWDVTQEEVDYLRAVIQATNTDLTLLPVGGL